MKEQLITFETAKLAKEKGLQIGVKTSYCEYHSKYVYDGDPEHPESHKKNEVRLDRDFYTVNNYKDIDLSNKHYTIYEAPTQSLLQKWLREEHNIHITITSISQESWQYHITKPGQRLGDNYEEDFYTYEEALESGLHQALKLI